MDVKKIYFDMDGVLADFDRGIKVLCGMEPMEQGKHNDDLLWEKVREVGHFYDKLEIMPGAKEMFDAIWERYGDKCEILSGIPKPKRGIETAGSDKINWIHRLLSEDIIINIVYREEKPLYCTGKDCILIDDYEKNIQEWEDIGGTGVLSINAEDTMEKLRQIGIL